MENRREMSDKSSELPHCDKARQMRVGQGGDWGGEGVSLAVT